MRTKLWTNSLNESFIILNLLFENIVLEYKIFFQTGVHKII